MLLSACHNPAGPGGPPLSLPANVVDPATVNAVSKFNSCVGHAFPLQNSPNSGKNYFWPISSNQSTNDQLRLYAACDGMITQDTDDTNDPSPIATSRGPSIHLYCDNSETGLRYFHINFPAGLIGQHVKAGDFMGDAVLLGTNQTPSPIWQNSSNFDIAVFEGDDSNTVDYFAVLSPPAFAAWATRGLTTITQTIVTPAPTCSTYNSNIGDSGILSLAPPL